MNVSIMTGGGERDRHAVNVRGIKWRRRFERTLVFPPRYNKVFIFHPRVHQGNRDSLALSSLCLVGELVRSITSRGKRRESADGILLRYKTLTCYACACVCVWSPARLDLLFPFFFFFKSHSTFLFSRQLRVDSKTKNKTRNNCRVRSSRGVRSPVASVPEGPTTY